LPVIVSPVLLEKVGAGFGNCRNLSHPGSAAWNQPIHRPFKENQPA